MHVPGFTGGRGGRGHDGGGIVLYISHSWTVPHTQLEPHQPIQDTHSVKYGYNNKSLSLLADRRWFKVEVITSFVTCLCGCQDYSISSHLP